MRCSSRHTTDYEPDRFWEVQPFLVGFFVLFSTMVFLHNLVNRKKSNLLDLLALFFNAGIFFVLSFRLVEEVFSREWVAAVTLGLAVFYLIHVVYFLQRKLLDRELLLTFMGLTAFFLAVTVPLILSKEWITVTWAIQAYVMLWIAVKLRQRIPAPDRLPALPHRAAAVRVSRSPTAVLHRHRNSQSSPGRLFAGDGATSGDVRRAHRHDRRRVPIDWRRIAGGADRRFGQRRAGLDPSELGGSAAVGIALGMLFLYLHLEINRTVGFLYDPLRLPVLTLLWVVICLLLLLEYLRTEQLLVGGLLILFAGGLLCKLFAFDLAGWRDGKSSVCRRLFAARRAVATA